MSAGKAFFLNGEWRSSEVVRAVTNPYDGRAAGRVCQASQTDVDEAIGAASAAFEETRALSAYERHLILSEVSRRIEAKREAFAGMITLETGKPISLARSEVDRSIFTFSVAAEEARRIGGDVLPLDLNNQSAGRFGIVRRFPLGPVGAITPFNFPLNLVAHKVAPAIAAGNAVVLKPSSSSPQVALLLAEAIEGTGLPKGAINIVPCLGAAAGQLVTDERIKLVSFTGSPAVGWPLKAMAGRKRVTLELGGNAAVIVDAGCDIDLAMQKIVSGAFGNAGQSCISVQRAYLHNSIWEHARKKLLELATGLKVGDPFDESTVVGPMITVEAAEKIEDWIAEAVRDGARVLCGGERTGAVMQPTVLENVNPTMRLSCMEAFAPILTIDPFNEIEDALERVNDSRYGLQAGIFTSNLRNALRAYDVLDVGGVVVNDVPTFRIDHMPYGGVKESGFGREGVRYAIEEMTELKLLVVNP